MSGPEAGGPARYTAPGREHRANAGAPMGLRDLITGYWVSQAVGVAAALGVADLLAHGPRTADELAAATGTHSPSLFRLLRALAGVGLFTQGEDGVFALAPGGERLRTGVPGSLRAYAMTFCGPRQWQAWGELAHSVATGERAYDHVFGTSFYDHLARDGEEGKRFTEAMSGSITDVAAALPEAYDFSGMATVVDVGGGDGAVLSSVMRAWPGVRGVLFEREALVEAGRRRLGGAGLEGRWEVVAGDFFTALPEGADAYLLVRVLRAFDDERAAAVLRACARALPAHGRVLVVERVLPPGDEPSRAKLADLNMLVLTGGQERSEAEYAALLRRAGLVLTRVVPAGEEMSVVEASAAGTGT